MTDRDGDMWIGMGGKKHNARADTHQTHPINKLRFAKQVRLLSNTTAKVIVIYDIILRRCNMKLYCLRSSEIVDGRLLDCTD